MGALTEPELDVASAAASDMAVWHPRFAELSRRARRRSSGSPRDARQVRQRHGRLGERDRRRGPALVERSRPTSGSSWPGSGPTSRPPTSRLGRSSTSSSSGSAARRRAGARRAPGRPGPRGQQRRDPARPCVALRHGPLRDRDLRARSLSGADPFEHGLEPALELRSYVADVKRFAAGASAGYGRRWRAPAETWVGVLPIGYGDGVRRGLTNNAEVLVGGARYPLVGTVSMDNVTIELGPARRRRRERSAAVLIGAQGDERILCEEVARRLETINYEVTCGISPRVPRVLRALRGPRERARSPRCSPSPRPCALCREALGDAAGCLDRGRSGPRRGARPRGHSTSTSRSPGTRARRRGRSPAGAGPMFSSPRSSAPGGRWRRAAPGTSTSRRFAAAASRPTSRSATSPSTRRRARSPTRRGAGRSHWRPRGPRRRGSCGRSSERSFADDPLRVLRAARIAADARRSELDPRNRGARPRAARSGPASRRASASSPSCACCSPATTRSAGSSCSTSWGRRPACCPSSRRSGASSRTPTTTSTSTATRSRCCARLLEVEADLDGLRRGRAPRRCAELLAEPLADELTRGGALRFGAVVHDLGKPATRGRGHGGYITFIGHDRDGRRDRRASCASACETSRRLAGLLART